MAKKKATGKTTRAASAKKKKASRATPAKKAARTKKTKKKTTKKTAGKAAAKKTTRAAAPKGSKRKPARAAPETPDPAVAAPDPPSLPPGGFPDATGGERALLGRGPWWWLASLSKTMPEAPDAASFRRDHAVESDAPKLQPGAPVTPVSLAAPMPGEGDAAEAPGAATDQDAVEPPDAPDPPGAAQRPESQVSQEISGTSQPDDFDDTDDIDELMEAIEALEALEAPDSPQAPQPAPAVEAEAPEPTAEAPPLDEVEEPAAPEAAPVDESLQAAAVEGPPSAGPADPEETLERLDDELANNVDKMLHGEFESVDELLEGEFNEPAPVGDGPDKAVGTSAETGVESEIAVAAHASEPPAAPIDAPDPEPVVDPADFIDLHEPDPEPAPADAEEAPIPADEPEVLAEPDPEPELQPEPVAAAAAPEHGVRPQAPRSLVRALVWMNAPRRRLPPPARVIVDWVALSLVFWVPIVWLFALIVVGR
jgi:hypothetical protein